MENVLTLIANPAGPALCDDEVAIAWAALFEAGATVEEPEWLADELACDISFSGFGPEVGDQAARQYLQDAPIDIVAQPRAGRRKLLLVADMDSTTISVECIDELADFAGLRAEVADITDRAMRGELDFERALIERAALLAGLDVEFMATAFAERVRLTPGARTLVRTMRANGAYTALVSGGFTFFTSRVRRMVGFDIDRANELVVADGRLTGAVREPILGPEAKLAALERLAGERGIQPNRTLAVGDGANDIPMIQAAGLGVAFHAKPLVAAAAAARIDHGDLTALLYLQGYRADEFAD